MADEPKSRVTNLVGLITAVTGLIAALVALSGALKSHFAPEAGNNSVAVAPGNSAVAAAGTPATGAVPTAPQGPATPGQARTIITQVRQPAGTAPAASVGVIAARPDRGTVATGYHAQPTEVVHVEPQSHAPEPDPAPQDDSTTPDSE